MTRRGSRQRGDLTDFIDALRAALDLDPICESNRKERKVLRRVTSHLSRSWPDEAYDGERGSYGKRKDGRDLGW